jgi:uncharacterized protein YjbI with pentapeptide repeats
MNMHIRRLAIAGIISLALTPTVLAAGVAQSVDRLEAQVSALQKENAALHENIDTLTAIVDRLVEEQRCHARPNTLQADSAGSYAGGVDWQGCDKTGLGMWGPNVGGAETEVLVNADLRFVNFTLANLIGIWAGGANLEGARFVNANLSYSDFGGAAVILPSDPDKAETVFVNTICPDETNSDDNGGTCFGHMTP